MMIHFRTFYPIFSLIAGLLILIFPAILNYVVAFYLIIMGILGILANANVL